MKSSIESLDHGLVLVFLRVYKIPLGKSIDKIVNEKRRSHHIADPIVTTICRAVVWTRLWASDRNVVKWNSCFVSSALHLTTYVQPSGIGQCRGILWYERSILSWLKLKE